MSAPPVGRLLASNCFACHGTNGRPAGGFDRLAGESASEIYDELKEMAGDRAGEIDIMVLYTDDSILQSGKDVERHRDTLGRIRDAGATWVSFAWDFSTQTETLAFVDGFAQTYLGNDRI